MNCHFAPGLFRGAIAESGSGVSNWAYDSNPAAYAREIVSKVANKTPNSTTELLQLLRSATAAQIHKASEEVTKPVRIFIYLMTCLG